MKCPKTASLRQECLGWGGKYVVNIIYSIDKIMQNASLSLVTQRHPLLLSSRKTWSSHHHRASQLLNGPRRPLSSLHFFSSKSKESIRSVWQSIDRTHGTSVGPSVVGPSNHRKPNKKKPAVLYRCFGCR